MKCTLIFLLAALSVGTSPAAGFTETWAYLMKGEERLFPKESPITDVACFSAKVNGDGYVEGGHLQPPSLSGATSKTRFHLVVTIPWNTTLAHLYLNPDLPFRNRIIAGIVERSGPFDGVQIDFESIHKDDGTAYLNFLAALKKALPKNKLFSVAVMARWEEHKQKNPTDAFDYPFIGRIADRVVVMAYDEHYSGGAPGPIASLPWCKKIHAYALKTIQPDKLVMGIPLYGRSWQRPALAKAYKNREIVAELVSKNIQPSNSLENGGSYRFSETVTVNVHYETMQSLETKLELYSSHPIRGVAFWRIGQEPAGFWNRITE